MKKKKQKREKQYVVLYNSEFVGSIYGTSHEINGSCIFIYYGKAIIWCSSIYDPTEVRLVSKKDDVVIRAEIAQEKG